MKRNKDVIKELRDGKMPLRLLTVMDAAEVLGVARNTFNGLLASGAISFVMVSKHTKRIPAQALADFVAKANNGVKK